jgi:hypothetical protein
MRCNRVAFDRAEGGRKKRIPGAGLVDTPNAAQGGFSNVKHEIGRLSTRRPFMFFIF